MFIYDLVDHDAEQYGHDNGQKGIKEPSQVKADEIADVLFHVLKQKGDS